MNALNATTPRAWLWNILLIVGGVLVLNGLIFLLPWFNSGGASSASGKGPRVPGWLVGLVWTGLFTGFASARWLLNRRQPRAARARWWVGAFIVACAAYPFYTAGLKSPALGLAGNGATLLLGAWVGARAWPYSRRAASLVWLVVPWVLFASYTILADGL